MAIAINWALRATQRCVVMFVAQMQKKWPSKFVPWPQLHGGGHFSNIDYGNLIAMNRLTSKLTKMTQFEKNKNLNKKCAQATILFFVFITVYYLLIHFEPISLH